MNLTNLITIFFSLSLWIRISRQIFEKSDKKAFIHTSIYSFLWVIIITALTLLLPYWSFTTTQITIFTIIFVSCIFLFPLQKTRIISQLIQSLITIGLASFSSSVFSHYITASRSEESLKWANIKNYTTWPLSKIILLCIISGIVFGASETMIYALSQLLHRKTTSSAITIIAQRSLIPIILHSGTVVISCLSAYYLSKKTYTIFAWIVWLIIGISIHLIFNLSNIYGYIPIIIFIILWCIWAISYGFFRSDTLYISKES